MVAIMTEINWFPEFEGCQELYEKLSVINITPTMVNHSNHSDDSDSSYDVIKRNNMAFNIWVMNTSGSITYTVEYTSNSYPYMSVFKDVYLPLIEQQVTDCKVNFKMGVGYHILFHYDKLTNVYCDNDHYNSCYPNNVITLAHSLATRFKYCQYRHCDWKGLIMALSCQIHDAKFQPLAIQLLVYDFKPNSDDEVYFNSVIDSHQLSLCEQ